MNESINESINQINQWRFKLCASLSAVSLAKNFSSFIDGIATGHSNLF